MALETDDKFRIVSLAFTPDNCTGSVLGVFYYRTCLWWTFGGRGYFG